MLIVVADAAAGAIYLVGHATGVHPMLALGILHLAMASLHAVGRERE
jgi:hypothetical protein